MGSNGDLNANTECLSSTGDVILDKAVRQWITWDKGVYKYLVKYFPDLNARGLVVGYDTRAQASSGCTSERLARLSAAVMLCKDVPVYLFSNYVPTPFVPYAVMKFGAAAGIMITASHNRKEDNGYKVYWHNSAHISSPHDKEILHCIEESTEP
ncbi:glucose 1,6-bisphosphate synthase-like [Triplophysa dalaica]|uniref:glucose 1,6-bisphosphate synthase-like n=1 Tax=Triplophysa dalaica TaxID=1582913 RepID=UPI0024DF6B0D|nr:glucose 1,6-bisphosphate synthase-like [Triplophysa dalaica]